MCIWIHYEYRYIMYQDMLCIWIYYESRYIMYQDTLCILIHFVFGYNLLIHIHKFKGKANFILHNIRKNIHKNICIITMYLHVFIWISNIIRKNTFVVNMYSYEGKYWNFLKYDTLEYFVYIIFMYLHVS